MGYYLAAADVEARLRKNYEALYTPNGGTAEDTSIVEADIEAAEADLHSYLAGRYLVPVTDAEAAKLCKQWALVLLQEIAYGAIPGRSLPENITTQVESLRKRLEKIADGQLSLGSAATIPEATGNSLAADIISDGPDPVFKRSQMGGY